MTNSSELFCRFLLMLAITAQGVAQKTSKSVLAAALPDAPQAKQPDRQFEPRAQQMTVAEIPPARKYSSVIEPGQTPYKFTATDKLLFSFAEVARPITLVPTLYSAGYEQLFETDPKYGNDPGAFGEKVGAAVLRRASVKVLANGVLAGVFHQDPRYYRIAHGSVIHRGLLSARQAVIRRADDGSNQFNYSGIFGRALAAALVTTYYPEPSVTGLVVANTFWTSIATDAGGNLVVEFLPSVAHRFPIMKKLGFE